MLRWERAPQPWVAWVHLRNPYDDRFLGALVLFFRTDTQAPEIMSFSEDIS